MFTVKKSSFNYKFADMSNFEYLQVIKEPNGDLIKMTNLKEEATEFISEEEANNFIHKMTGNRTNDSFVIEEAENV